MPIIRHKGQKILLHWKKEWIRAVLAISDNPAYRKKNGQIDWQGAEANGLLRGFPKQLSLNDISRYTATARIKRNPKKYRAWKKRRRKYSSSHKFPSRSWATLRRQMVIFYKIPLKKRRAMGYRPKFINTHWTEKQDRLLMVLSRDRKFRLGSGKYINWKKLLQDRRAKKLPTNNRREVENRYSRIKNIRSRRQKALEWKYKNLKRYHRNQSRRRRMIKEIVNSSLYAALPTRP